MLRNDCIGCFKCYRAGNLKKREETSTEFDCLQLLCRGTKVSAKVDQHSFASPEAHVQETFRHLKVLGQVPWHIAYPKRARDRWGILLGTLLCQKSRIAGTVHVVHEACTLWICWEGPAGYGTPMREYKPE